MDGERRSRRAQTACPDRIATAQVDPHVSHSGSHGRYGRSVPALPPDPTTSPRRDAPTPSPPQASQSSAQLVADGLGAAAVATSEGRARGTLPADALTAAGNGEPSSQVVALVALADTTCRAVAGLDPWPVQHTADLTLHLWRAASGPVHLDVRTVRRGRNVHVLEGSFVDRVASTASTEPFGWVSVTLVPSPERPPASSSAPPTGRGAAAAPQGAGSVVPGRWDDRVGLRRDGDGWYVDPEHGAGRGSGDVATACLVALATRALSTSAAAGDVEWPRVTELHVSVVEHNAARTLRARTRHVAPDASRSAASVEIAGPAPHFTVHALVLVAGPPGTATATAVAGTPAPRPEDRR